MNSRGRRTQRRAAERREYKAQQAKLLELQRSFRPKKRKIKNEQPPCGHYYVLGNLSRMVCRLCGAELF